jgi:hypothetical protein
MGRGVVKKCAALLMLAGAPTAFAMVKLQRAFTAIVPAKFQTDEQRAADAGTPGTFFQNVAGTPWETDFAATPNAKYEMFAGAAEQSAFDPTTKLVFAAGEQGYLHVFGAPSFATVPHPSTQPMWQTRWMPLERGSAVGPLSTRWKRRGPVGGVANRREAPLPCRRAWERFARGRRRG